MMAFQIAIGVSKFGIIYVLVNSAFENDVGRLLYQAFSDNWTNTTSEFFEVDAQPVIAAMKLALVKDVTPKDDIAEDEESLQALAKVTRKSCKSYCLLVNSP